MTQWTTDEDGKALAAARPAAVDAMAALFAYALAMDEGNVTGRELTDVMRASIAAGHDSLEIVLSMGLHALRRAREQSSQGRAG